MPTSLSHRGGLKPGHFFIERDELPALDAGPMDLHGWFVRDGADDRSGRPLELEIGSGKGTFLVNEARAHPEVNYVGIEYARAYARHAADRLRRHALHNARMVHCEAAGFVRHYVADRSLRQMHIYFPDPWPKKRHNKRRLIQESFLRELHRVLMDADDGDAESGQVRLATDHADYFDWMQEHAARVDALFERLPFVSPTWAAEGELVGTNFERKYRREGRVFQGMILRKRG